LNSSLCNAIPSAGIEIEVTSAYTRKQNGGVDQFKINGRYILRDDVAGDPLSLAIGASLTKAFWSSLKDVSSFHHGLGEAELFVSFGKERALGLDWGSRLWGLAGIGFAERGSPWLHFELKSASRWRENHAFTIFLNSLWGLGGKSLQRRHFHGYGSIHHQSIDLGLRYEYFIQFVGELSLEYSYRVHAINFPADVHRLTAEFLYTFGL
jgi:hypothetical protein